VLYKDLLIPDYNAMQKAFPDHQVVITEDSATTHGLAKKLYAPEPEKACMEFVGWSANSPDLYPIEGLRKHQKVMSKDLRCGVDSAAKQVKQHAMLDGEFVLIFVYIWPVMARITNPSFAVARDIPSYVGG
jgi:hypothetical protein